MNRGRTILGTLVLGGVLAVFVVYQFLIPQKSEQTFSAEAGYATQTPTLKSVTSISEVSQETQETPEEVGHDIIATGDIMPTVYIVAKGDMLSCLFPKNWEETAKQNGITNPDLIYPGQKVNLLPGTEVHGGCVAQHKQSVGYCNIGADPVNPNRELSALEREYRLEDDTLVRMGTGSGKEVKCILKKDEVVIIDENNEVKWVRVCGNPILNKVIVAADKPTQQAVEISAVPEEKVKPKKKSGLIILKTFEGATSSETSGGILRDSYGNVVHDDFGNPVKTETK